MISRATPDFWACFAGLPPNVRRTARSAYALWSADPRYPSLHFKPVPTAGEDVWSVRIGIHWRSLGVRDGGTIIWFWIGSHADYDRLRAGVGGYRRTGADAAPPRWEHSQVEPQRCRRQELALERVQSAQALIEAVDALLTGRS